VVLVELLQMEHQQEQIPLLVAVAVVLAQPVVVVLVVRGLSTSVLELHK
jgi:hypothetical protein